MPEVFRLAHFSDIHVTIPPLSQPFSELRGKRRAGLLSYYFGRRRWRFWDVDTRIQALLEDVEAQKPHHAICTGDITQMSFDAEFDRCAELFGARLQQPDRWTVIPGNHDRYVPWAVTAGTFEQRFGSLCGGGRFPTVKRIHPRVAVVMLDVARPCTFTDSSGLCGPEQLKRAEELLSDASLRDTFVVVALHYGLLRAGGVRDKPTHRIQDDQALVAMLDGDHIRCDLVVHGHMHRAFSVRTAKRLVHCAGSATDLYVAGGYNVYDIDLDSRALTHHRRHWDKTASAYRPAPAA